MIIFTFNINAIAFIAIHSAIACISKDLYTTTQSGGIEVSGVHTLDIMTCPTQKESL